MNTITAAWLACAIVVIGAILIAIKALRGKA